MARNQKDCPLCPPALDRDQHDLVYYEYQETRDFARGAERATELGSPATPEETRAHFQYHRIVQPPPRGYLRRARALERARNLPERMQDIVTLISRVKALSASQLAELFYWTGSEEQTASARNACYRDLRRLILEDLVYRYYPPATARPSGGKRARQDQLSLYFLGRDATPYIEEREERELSRRDWISGTDQLSDDLRVIAQHETAEVVGSLARQVRTFEALGRRPQVEGAPPLAVHFNPLNWFGRERTAFTFTDPLSSRSESVSPGGLCAVGLAVPERSFSVLAPLFYDYDPGVKPASAYAEDLLGYMFLARSGALHERFPELPRRGYFPPVAIVCREMGRVIALQEEMGRLLHKRNLTDAQLPVIVITDEVTHTHHGLAGQSWLSLWDHSLEGKRYRLLEVLLHSCRPLVNALTADAQLLHRTN